MRPDEGRLTIGQAPFAYPVTRLLVVPVAVGKPDVAEIEMC